MIYDLVFHHSFQSLLDCLKFNPHDLAYWYFYSYITVIIVCKWFIKLGTSNYFAA
jgi:hypothetical protein